jgi:hypothetical protein
VTIRRSSRSRAAVTAQKNTSNICRLLIDYYHAIHANLPSVAGQLGAAYAIPILYVPLLMITQMVALYWLLRQPRQATA